MKQLCGCLRSLRCHLQMMSIPYHIPVSARGDTQSVLHNTSIPKLILKKKKKSTTHHLGSAGVARNEWRASCVNTQDNETDLLTKVLPSGEKRKGFERRMIHHVYGERQFYFLLL